LSIGLLRDAMQEVVDQADLIAKGYYETDVLLRSEQDVLGVSLQQMTVNLREAKTSNDHQSWLKTTQTELAKVMSGNQAVASVCGGALGYLANAFNAEVGAFYIVDPEVDNDTLCFIVGYAIDEMSELKKNIPFGEGLLGRVAVAKKINVVSGLDQNHLSLSSALGVSVPNHILMAPLVSNGEVAGVIELGAIHQFTSEQIELIGIVSESIAISLQASLSNKVTTLLLEQTQLQSEELQAANENLEEHTQQLKKSEEQLKQQSEELKVSNEELMEKQQKLQLQKVEVETAKQEIEHKAQQLEQASKYKSEFLANMSHELRTPLNSLLILSNSLAENKKGNLTVEQQEDAKIIYDGGRELLNLINDIMDLSKVEAGMLNLNVDTVYLKDIAGNMETLFLRLAEEKCVSFSVELDEELEESIHTDSQRLQQIVKNFMSNAIKFTEKGFIKLSIHCIGKTQQLNYSNLNPETGIGISVSDSGVGIPLDKQQAIFEVFQQADGSVSRDYGGTGLGLTISRELARLLGGEIHLQSTLGEGSVFTVYIPKIWHEISEPGQDKGALLSKPSVRKENGTASSGNLNVTIESHGAGELVGRDKENQSRNIVYREAPNATTSVSTTGISDQWLPDDRLNVRHGDNVLLIIEDDPAFAKILQRIARENDQKVLLTPKGREGVLMAIEYKPCGILLDMGLPDIGGLEVLDQLKYNLDTRDIPVHAISAGDYKHSSIERGALSFIEKPVSEHSIKEALNDINISLVDEQKTVLVVEDDVKSQRAIGRLLESNNTKLSFAGSLKGACGKLDKELFDCIILDLGLPDAQGAEVLEIVSCHSNVGDTPIIVYTGREIDDEGHKILNEFSDSIIVKGAESPERLLDDVSLFLHSVGSHLPSNQQETIKMLHNEDAMLEGRRVLLVDDDMRNVFALKRMLMDAGLVVVPAENGQVAVDKVRAAEQDPFELILMDIMMPIKNGYEAMREIRAMPGYSDTPIMALTAKAMPEDRQKCIDAGASDYVTKPIDITKLLSMLRVWLYKRVEYKSA